MTRHFLWLMLLFPLSAAAQTEMEIVKPKQPTSLRETPPNGGFLSSFPGNEIGQTETDKRYRILEKRQTPDGFSTQTWIKIAPLDKDGNIVESGKGWSYWGATLSVESRNFQKEGNLTLNSS